MAYLVIGMIIAGINLVFVADPQFFNKRAMNILMFMWIVFWPLVIVAWIFFGLFHRTKL